jgi:hypothetical protein
MTTQNLPVQPNPKEKATTWILWISVGCLGLSAILAFLSPALFCLYVPLAIAALILGIIGITRGRIFAGVTILLLSLILPGALAILSFSIAKVANDQAKLDAIRQLSLDVTTCSHSYSYVTVGGTVTNNGDTSVAFVKIMAEIRSGSGQVLDSDWTYLVGSEGIAPGTTKSWETMIPYNPDFESCFARIAQE